VGSYLNLTIAATGLRPLPLLKTCPALLSFSELRTDRVLGNCSRGSHTTDKEVAFSSMVFNHVVDGRVEEHWFQMDLLRLMGLLGAIPEPEQSEEANRILRTSR
jgi:hypothetical protein